MYDLETENLYSPCKKLGGVAHVRVQYFNGKGGSSLADFECDKVADCGIGRSSFSRTYNYTVHCPIYIKLEKILAAEAKGTAA